MNAFLANSLFFGAMLTIACYAIGLMLKKRFKLAILNPVLISVICVIGVLCVCDVEYEAYKKSADVISYFLTPATVCLALPLYDKLFLLKKYWKAVCVSLLGGVVTSLGSVVILCKLMSLSPELCATLLPNSITTAVGMNLAQEMGGIASMAAACIILTGIFGSITCEWIFKLLRIHSPVAKGLAIGAASHAIGTSRALELGITEAAMSSLALAVCGLLTVLLAPLFLRLL